MVDETDYLLGAGMCRGCAEELEAHPGTECQCSACGKEVDGYLLDGLCPDCADEAGEERK